MFMYTYKKNVNMYKDLEKTADNHLLMVPNILSIISYEVSIFKEKFCHFVHIRFNL